MTLEERNELILKNAPLVTSVVKKMYCDAHAFYDKQDMYQEGMIGLIKAVERFNPELGFAFSTYAVPMIKGEIMRFVRDNSHVLKYSRSDIDALRRVNNLGKSIDELTPAEIEELELTEKNIFAIRSMQATSINAPISDDGDSELGDMLADPNTSSEFSDDYLIEVIENIKNLVLYKMSPEKQDLIDEWYYSVKIGIKPGQQYLGRKYGQSQAQVSRDIRIFKAKFAKKLIESGYVVPNYISSDEE